MKYLKQFVIAIVLFVLQTTLFSKLKIWNVVPNFILAYVVVIAASKDMNESLFTALFLGLLSDSLQNRFFGLDLVYFLFIAVLINYLCDKYVRGNFMVATLFIFGSNFLYSIVFFIINYFFAKDSGFFNYVFRQGIISSFYVSIIMFVLLFFLDPRLYHKKNYNL